MRKTASLLLFVAGSLILALPCGALANGVSPDETDGSYTVKQGDTLWGIAGSELKDPDDWPSIWKANPGIQDPDLIFPGEKVVLPGGAEATAPAPRAEEKTREHAPARAVGHARSSEEDNGAIATPGQAAIVAPKEKHANVIVIESEHKKIPIASASYVLSAGFIDADLKTAYRILGSPADERDVFTVGDILYVEPKGDIKVGDRFVIFRPGPEVVNPATGKPMGCMTVVSGILELKDKKDGTLMGEVTTAYLEVNQTDLLVPFTTPALVYEPVPENPALAGKWGYIAAFTEERTISTTLNVVYLNLGSDDGVKPGDGFEVRRPGGKVYSDDYAKFAMFKRYDLPEVSIGHIRVISVQPKSSTAVVMDDLEPMKTGYRVYYSN